MHYGIYFLGTSTDSPSWCELDGSTVYLVYANHAAAQGEADHLNTLHGPYYEARELPSTVKHCDPYDIGDRHVTLRNFFQTHGEMPLND